MSDIVERLRARQVTNWVHATGQTPRASGKRTDPLCAAAADEIERLRAEVAALREDAARLDFLLHKLPGDALRYAIGELSDTSDEAMFRATIDAARAKGGA